MPKPEVGTYNNFYCGCIEKSKKDMQWDRDGLVSGRDISVPTPQSTTWICKKKYLDSFRKKTGLFSSEEHTIWRYYWECMNCGKQTVIGVWDCCGASYSSDYKP